MWAAPRAVLTRSPQAISHGELGSAASALAAIAASLITALSLLFLVIQLREQRRYTLAEFGNGFGKEFAEFDHVFETLLLRQDEPTPAVVRLPETIQLRGSYDPLLVLRPSN
jgi:hypothetical protein